jgi:suppressor of ftsI
MNRKRFVVTSASVAAVGAALAADGCSNNVVNSFVPANGGNTAPVVGYTLTTQYAITTIQGKRLRTRTYDGRTYGPTLTAQRGRMLNVKIVNKLPPNPPAQPPQGRTMIVDARTLEDVMMPMHLGKRPSVHIDPMNNPHGFNSTNLHVHGIQTTPHLFNPVGTSNPKADMIVIEPGKSLQYQLPVPEDHPCGLHWYHPHKHGSTDVQVSGGMAGLIVVRGPVDEVPEIAAAREIFMVVQSLNVNKSKTQKDLYEREYLAYKPGDEGGYQLFTQFTMLTVNGNGVVWLDNTGKDPEILESFAPPQFTMRPGEVVRLRLLDGCNGIPLALALPGFEAWMIGFDGVNTLEPVYTDISGTGVSVVTPENMLSGPLRLAVEGNRIEMLLRAPATAGTYTLSSLPTKGVDFSAFQQFDLATFVVSGKKMKMGIPKTLPKPTREYPLITDAEIVAHREFLFSEGKDDSLFSGFGFKINHSLYKMMECPTTVKRGTCEEWLLINDTTEGHPFHLHMVSFQVTEINGVKLDPVEIWDTFIIPPKVKDKNGSLRIRIRFLQFVGKEVFHCHILPHEDTGMMQNFLIQ